MGLSNPERFSKIAWSIHHITNFYESLRDTYQYTRLKALLLKLWPAFLGGRRNSMFWIFGGDLDNSKLGEMSLVSLAFHKHFYENHTDPDAWDSDEDIIEEKEKAEKVPYHKRWSVQKSIREMLDLETLINDNEKRVVLEIFHHVENIEYALTRYDDEFTTSLSNLNDLLRRLQGELFNVLQTDEDYYRVWLVRNIVEKATRHFGQHDFVFHWICKQNIHHDLRLMRGHDTKELQETWKFIRSSTASVEQRLLIVMALAGHRFHYKHQHNELLKMIDEHNASAGENDIISTDRAKEVMKWCVEQHTRYEKDTQEEIKSYCALFD